jgi:hypothetical protein
VAVSEQELLNPQDQDAVLQDIALVLAHNLPPGWQECLVVHGALGAHAETTVRIERLNGPPIDVTGPEVLGELFARLRTGMYRPGVGTWFSARFQLTHPVDYRVEYDGTGQPHWSAPPPPEAYADDLRSFPRDPEHIPDWLVRSSDDTAEGQSAGAGEPTAPADGAAPRFQMARVFDSLGPGQTPQVNRPPVPDGEVEAVTDYLTKAAMVLAARSLDEDLLDPARPAKVPLTYLTDGTWIWPGGVGYYLRTHGVPPEPELVEHIRGRSFQPPEVDDYTRDEAVAAIMGQPPPARPAPASASPEPVAPAAPGVPGVPMDGPVPLAPAGPPRPRPEPAVVETAVVETAVPENVASQGMPPQDTGLDTTGLDTTGLENTGPAAAAPVEPPVRAADERALDRLRVRLGELGVDPESYGVEVIVEQAWCLVREGSGWAVFLTANGDRAVSVAFPTADQAAAFLLGSLLMAPGRSPVPPRPRPSGRPDVPSVTQPDLRRPARTYDGPIEPLAGEPPVTLFRNLRELELVAGTEIDRFGAPEGNLAYAAGTHYSQRSLPPEWADRPYHAYRLQQPLRALVGTAVPWFEQPGGGTGYFLPVSISALLSDGALVEIESARI